LCLIVGVNLWVIKILEDCFAIMFVAHRVPLKSLRNSESQLTPELAVASVRPRHRQFHHRIHKPTLSSHDFCWSLYVCEFDKRRRFVHIRDGEVPVRIAVGLNPANLRTLQSTLLSSQPQRPRPSHRPYSRFLTFPFLFILQLARCLFKSWSFVIEIAYTKSLIRYMLN